MISIRTALISFLLTILLLGCVAKQIKITEPFREADLLKYSSGIHTVSGQAFMLQRGGVVVTCAGNNVTIYPATPFMVEIFKVYASGGNPIFGIDGQKDGFNKTVTYSKTTKCDAEGNFIFKNVAIGSWVIETTVSWYAGDSLQGGTIKEIIEVKEGMKKVILN